MVGTLGQQLAWLQGRVKLDSLNSPRPLSSHAAGASRPHRGSERGGPIESSRALRRRVTDLAQAVRAEVQECRPYRGVCGHCRKTHESRLSAHRADLREPARAGGLAADLRAPPRRRSAMESCSPQGRYLRAWLGADPVPSRL